MNWPAYFQPASQPPSLHTEASFAGQPICLLDAFYVGNADCAPELFVVVGLEGGGLQALHAQAVQTLPDALQRQLRAALVSRRGALRTIQASQLFLFALDSIEQREMSGWNDAVLLYGRAQASLDCLLSMWEVTPLNQPGALTAGRLDVLNGYALGFEHVWRNPELSREFISHLFLPAGSLAEVKLGRSLALAYPLFDADTAGAVHHADNTSLVMRLVYDVLLKLQQDVARQAAGKATGQENLQAFAKGMLPVPSRQRLEYELAAEGYEVRGDEAVRVGKPDPLAQHDLLDRLRRWAASWNAPRIALPPQARPQDYRRLIERALALAANEHDRAMMAALVHRLQAGAQPAAPKRRQPQPNPQKPRKVPERKRTEVRADAPTYEATPRFDEALSQPLPPAQPAPHVHTPRGEDWSKDFGKPAAPKTNPPTPEDWAGDFDSGSDVSGESGPANDNSGNDFRA